MATWQAQRAPRPAPRAGYPLFAGGCDAEPGGSHTLDNNARIAQSFLATRGGTLDEIRVEITKEAGTVGNWVMQLVPTFGGVPAYQPTWVFAAAAVDDPDVPVGGSTLPARFRGISLLAGETYAVVVPRSGGAPFTVRGGFGCDDGRGWNATSELPLSGVPSNIDCFGSVFVV